MSSENSSASAIASNCDLLRQILLCLPVKSLLAFKSVSKQWLCLISDPHFVGSHARRNRSLPIPGLFFPKDFDFSTKNEYKLIFLDGHVNAGDVPIPIPILRFGNDPAHMDIQQSCNGLLHFRCFQMVDESNGKMALLFCIYNLSAKRIKILPLFPSSKNSMSTFRSVSIAFNPIKSPHYEVVVVSMVSIPTQYQIEIYSSKTDTWRVSGNVFPAAADVFEYSGVFWNGCLHWISSSLAESSSFYFDVERELVKTMPMPLVPEGWTERNIKYFGECGGCMHLIEIYDPCTTCFDILEMVSDYTGWTVKYRVDVIGLTIAYPEMLHENIDFSVLLVDEGEEKSSKLLFRIADKVVSYDLNKKSFKKIHDISTRVTQRYEFRYVHKYIESLVSV